MSDQTNLEALIEAAKRLPLDDQRQLLEALLAQPSPPAESRHRITEMRGLGKELWRGIDAQEYVDRERDSWKS